MRRPVIALLLALAALAVWAALSQGKSRPVGKSQIERIVSAPARHSYEAVGHTTVHYGGNTLKSGVKVFHSGSGGHRIEYLSAPLDGIVVVDSGESIRRYDPRLNTTVAVQTGATSDSNHTLDLLMSNYRLERTKSDPVAGRRAYGILVKNESGRLMKRLRVDARTHVVLASEEYGADRKPQSSTHFESIKYVQDLPESLFSHLPAEGAACLQGAGRPVSRAELSKAVGFTVRAPRYIPKGYALDSYRLYECPCGCGHRSAYVRYTNGLKAVSIFQTGSNSSCLSEGACRHEGLSTRERAAAVTSGGVSCVVIGDLPPGELKRVADGCVSP